MKKRLIRALVLMVIFTTIVGLVPSMAQGKVTLRYWALADWLPASENSLLGSFWKDTFAAFSAKYPDITLQWENMPGYEEYRNKLLAAGQAGTLPDVTLTDCSWIMQLSQMKAFVPLNSLWSASDRSQYYDVFMRGVTDSKTGDVFGIWHETDVRLLYYRKDMFAAAGISGPPKTWEEMVGDAKKLTTANRNGLIFPAGMHGGTPVVSMLPLFWGEGGKEFDENLAPSFHVGKNREIFLDVLRRYHDLVKVYKVSPVDVVNFLGEGDMEPSALGGTTAMFLGGSWQYNTLKQKAPQDYDNWAGSPIPMPAGSPFPNATCAGGWVYTITAKQKDKVNAAWKFLNFITTDEMLAKYCVISANVPTKKTVFDVPYFKQNTPERWYSIYRAQLFNAGVRKASPVWPIMDRAWQKAIGSVITEQQTPEQALDEAAKTVMDAYNRTR